MTVTRLVATLPAASRAWTVSVTDSPLRNAVRMRLVRVNVRVELPAFTPLRVTFRIVRALAFAFLRAVAVMVRSARSSSVMVVRNLPVRRTAKVPVLVKRSVARSRGAVLSAAGCCGTGVGVGWAGCGVGVAVAWRSPWPSGSA